MHDEGEDDPAPGDDVQKPAVEPMFGAVLSAAAAHLPAADFEIQLFDHRRGDFFAAHPALLDLAVGEGGEHPGWPYVIAADDGEGAEEQLAHGRASAVRVMIRWVALSPAVLEKTS